MTTAVRHPGASGPTPFSAAGRFVRVGVFTAVSLLLAVAAHRLAGAAAPSSALLSICSGTLAGFGWLISRRERSGRFIGALVVGNQALLHLVFAAPLLLAAVRAEGAGGSGLSLAQFLLCHHGPSSISSASLDAATSNMDPAALRALTQRASTAVTADGGTAQIIQMVAMLVAHLVAAAVVAWWLRRGERAACAIVSRALSRLMDPLGLPPLPNHRLEIISTPRGGSSRWVGAVAGRGPPSWVDLPLLPLA